MQDNQLLEFGMEVIKKRKGTNVPLLLTNHIELMLL